MGHALHHVMNKVWGGGKEGEQFPCMGNTNQSYLSLTPNTSLK